MKRLLWRATAAMGIFGRGGVKVETRKVSKNPNLERDTDRNEMGLVCKWAEFQKFWARLNKGPTKKFLGTKISFYEREN